MFLPPFGIVTQNRRALTRAKVHVITIHQLFRKWIVKIYQNLPDVRLQHFTNKSPSSRGSNGTKAAQHSKKGEKTAAPPVLGCCHPMVS